MNIGLFSETYPPQINGVAISTQNLFNVLRKNGHNAYLVTTNPLSNHLEYKDNVLYIPGLELKKLYGYRLASFYNSRAMKIIRNWHLDIIHIQTEASIGIFGKIIATRFGLPTVNTYHTMYEDYTHYVGKGVHFNRLAKVVVRGLSKYVAMQCTEFISPSEKTKEVFRQYGTDRYINIVPTGIDFTKFDENKQNKEKLNEYKKEQQIDDKFIVLSLGRLGKEKAVDVLLKGYAKFLKHHKNDVVLLIVGDGPEKKALLELTKELDLDNHVRFIGAVATNEVAFYYHLADVFVSASITETQGLTFMEAMASKRLVLARYDENLRGTIINNETGFFFDNEDDFHIKLARIKQMDPISKQKVIEQALVTLDKYSIDNFYQSIMEVYHRALRKYW